MQRSGWITWAHKRSSPSSSGAPGSQQSRALHQFNVVEILEIGNQGVKPGLVGPCRPQLSPDSQSVGLSLEGVDPGQDRTARAPAWESPLGLWGAGWMQRRRDHLRIGGRGDAHHGGVESALRPVSWRPSPCHWMPPQPSSEAANSMKRHTDSCRPVASAAVVPARYGFWFYSAGGWKRGDDQCVATARPSRLMCGGE